MNFKEFSEIIQSLKDSKIFNTHFIEYIENNYPVHSITLELVFEKFHEILNDVKEIYKDSNVLEILKK